MVPGVFCELAAARPSRRPPVDAGAGARASPGFGAALSARDWSGAGLERPEPARRPLGRCGATARGGRASNMASAQEGRRASSTKIKSVSLRRRPPRAARTGPRAATRRRSVRPRPRPPPAAAVARPRARWPLRGACDAGGDATEDGDGAAQAKSSPGAAQAMGLSVFGAKLREGSLGWCRTGASVVGAAWGRRMGRQRLGRALRAPPRAPTAPPGALPSCRGAPGSARGPTRP